MSLLEHYLTTLEQPWPQPPKGGTTQGIVRILARSSSANDDSEQGTEQGTVPWTPFRALPEAIREIRKTFDVSRRDIATWVKVTPRTVERWEAGKASPYRRNILNIVTELRRILNEREADSRFDYDSAAWAMFSLLAHWVAGHLTSPIAMWDAEYIDSFLREPPHHDHRDLRPAVVSELQATYSFTTAHVGEAKYLVAARPSNNIDPISPDVVALPLIPDDVEPELRTLLATLSSLSEKDLLLIVELSKRLARGDPAI